MNSKKNIVYVIVIVILVIAIIILSCFLINSQKDKKVAENKLAELSTTSVSQEETIRNLYLQKIKTADSENTEKLLDYKIDSVHIYTGSERTSLVSSLYPNASADDIFAEIVYSVKPANTSSSTWIAGNGDVSGDWIVGKTSCVYAVKENNNYVIKSDGTGW